MLVAAAAVRLNNVVRFPSLRAFDGFGHFTYIWFMADQWRVPLPTSGWSFFHPPLYYAFMATIWTLLAPVDAIVRLDVGTGLIAMLGLIHGVAIFAITRRYFPGRHLVQLLAAGLMFFLPLHLYTAGFLGNENLNAVLCSLSLVTLLWVLRRPSVARGALLGLCLGLAILTKFTALAIVVGAFGTLALQTLVHRSWRTGTLTLAAACSVMLLVSGWFYARNVNMYGTPFKMSRDEFMVRHVENYQSQGLRNLWEYVLFDPLILRRPSWPRGIPLTGEFPADFPHDALRESVLTGLYANAWFDSAGNTVLPGVQYSDVTRHAGQILLTLGLVPSILVVVGVATALQRLWRRGWDATLVTMLTTSVGMAGLFVKAMNTVPMHAAVKATYIEPVALVFAFWFALGADRLGRVSERWLRRAAAVCALLAVVSVVVFSSSVFIARDWLVEASDNSPPWQNLYGIVYYASGNRERAQELFQSAADKNWHLAHENLAFLAMQDGRPLEALYRVRSAAWQQPNQSFGTREDRAHFNDLVQADYQNQMAVIYYQLGRMDLALAAANAAYRYDETNPEIRYDLAIVKLTRALTEAHSSEAHLREAIAQSRALLSAAALDEPAFFEILALEGALDALEGNCDPGMQKIRRALAPHPGEYRRYPITTGPGNMHTAALRRRVHIEELPEALRPEHQLARCSAQAHESGHGVPPAE
jgi:tetratricopeptide (TPR) repeat protein